MINPTVSPPRSQVPLQIALIDDYGKLAQKLSLWRRLDPKHFKLDFYDHRPEIKILQNYTVIIAIRERTIFSKTLLEKLPKLKHIALTGRASGQVDLDAAKKHRITISLSPGSRQTTAELTAAFILAHAKKIIHHHQSMRKGAWITDFSEELCGKTIGILGLGRIGKQVAAFATTMQMNVLSWDSGRPSAFAEKHNIPRLPLSELMHLSHFVTLHLPLNAETQGIITRQHLSALSPESLLINTARAKLIEKGALIESLLARPITAALDVYEEEPLTPDHPLLSLPNVILTPHIGYVTPEVYRAFFEAAITNIINFAAGHSF